MPQTQPALGEDARLWFNASRNRLHSTAHKPTEPAQNAVQKHFFGLRPSPGVVVGRESRRAPRFQFDAHLARIAAAPPPPLPWPHTSGRIVLASRSSSSGAATGCSSCWTLRRAYALDYPLWYALRWLNGNAAVRVNGHRRVGGQHHVRGHERRADELGVLDFHAILTKVGENHLRAAF